MSTSESSKTPLPVDDDEDWSSICKLSVDELYARHAEVSRQAFASTVGTVVSVAEIPLTFGMSLLFAPFKARKMNVNNRMKALIEKRLLELDHSKYSLNSWDIMIPFGAAAISMTVALATMGGAELLGVDCGIEKLAEFAASQIAAAANVATETSVEVAATQIATAATQIAAGGAAVTETSCEVTATQLAAGGVAATAAEIAGEAVTAEGSITDKLLKGVEKVTVGEVVQTAVEHAMNSARPYKVCVKVS